MAQVSSKYGGCNLDRRGLGPKLLIEGGKERRKLQGGSPGPTSLLLVDFFFFFLSRAPSTNNVKDKRKAISNAGRPAQFPWSLLASQHCTAHQIKSGCMVGYVEPIHRIQFRFPTNLSCASCLGGRDARFFAKGGRLAAGDPSPTRTFSHVPACPSVFFGHQGPSFWGVYSRRRRGTADRPWRFAFPQLGLRAQRHSQRLSEGQSDLTYVFP